MHKKILLINASIIIIKKYLIKIVIYIPLNIFYIKVHPCTAEFESKHSMQNTLL